jgi:hypothetical protein
MRNNVVTIITTATLIASQLAVPAMPQATTLPYPPPGGPQIQPPRPGGPQIQPPRPGDGYGYQGTIRCESRNNNTQRCNVRTDNRVDLQRVIGGRCSKGRDWGFTATQIWVSGGCRAEFAYGYANNGGGYPTPLPQPVEDYAGTLNCESWNYAYQQCNVPTNNRVELTRKIAGKCNAGRQWGYTGDYIWVDKGCRAEFGYGYRNTRPPEKDKDKGPSTGLIIGGIVVAGGLIALLASQKKKKADGTATEEAVVTHPARGPATLSANLSSLPSAARPSVQNCMTDAARQIGITGGTKLSYDKLVSLEQGNGGWRIRATMTATYPDGAKQVEMFCRATPTDIIQLDFT